MSSSPFVLCCMSPRARGTPSQCSISQIACELARATCDDCMQIHFDVFCRWRQMCVLSVKVLIYVVTCRKHACGWNPQVLARTRAWLASRKMFPRDVAFLTTSDGLRSHSCHISRQLLDGLAMDMLGFYILAETSCPPTVSAKTQRFCWEKMCIFVLGAQARGYTGSLFIGGWASAVPICGGSRGPSLEISCVCFKRKGTPLKNIVCRWQQSCICE